MKPIPMTTDYPRTWIKTHYVNGHQVLMYGQRMKNGYRIITAVDLGLENIGTLHVVKDYEGTPTQAEFNSLTTEAEAEQIYIDVKAQLKKSWDEGLEGQIAMGYDC